MMSKRRQFVLDERTNELLEELAADRAGNLSFVVREAIQLYAEMDSRLDQIEQDPEFQRMMERSEDDIRAGRLVSHEEVKRRIRKQKPAS
jgi:predicted transcriptional regulator